MRPQTSVPWIDEFYDLAARFPQRQGFKLTKVQVKFSRLPISRR